MKILQRFINRKGGTMRLLILLGVVVSTASAAMTEQQLVYGLAKLYHKINQLPDANKWVHFTKAIMGWHITEKKRQSTQKERTMEGLYNLERLVKGTLGTLIDNPAYKFVELVDMEPNFGKYFNDTLSNLFFDHLSYVYQQICLMKYKAAKDELERILISTEVDVSDVPTEPVKGYELMANGFANFVELSGKTSTFTTEVSRMKEISKLFDSMKNASLALQDEFYKSQRKIVYACLRQPKEGYFDGALQALLTNFVNPGNWMLKAFQWCTTTKKTLGAAVAMSRCIANPPSEEELMKHEGEVDDTLFDEKDFFQNLAEFTRSFNIYRDASFTEEVRIGVEDLNLINDMKSSDPYDIIREAFTYFFVELGVEKCAVPKLDAMVAKAHQDTSTTTKFQGVYDDLMVIFETCWKWPEGMN